MSLESHWSHPTPVRTGHAIPPLHSSPLTSCFSARGPDHLLPDGLRSRRGIHESPIKVVLCHIIVSLELTNGDSLCKSLNPPRALSKTCYEFTTACSPGIEASMSNGLNKATAVYLSPSARCGWTSSIPGNVLLLIFPGYSKLSSTGPSVCGLIP